MGKERSASRALGRVRGWRDCFCIVVYPGVVIDGLFTCLEMCGCAGGRLYLAIVVGESGWIGERHRFGS